MSDMEPTTPQDLGVLPDMSDIEPTTPQHLKVLSDMGVSVYFLNGTSAREAYLVLFKVYMMDRI